MDILCLLCLISPGNWLVSINLSDAYLSVAILCLLILLYLFNLWRIWIYSKYKRVNWSQFSNCVILVKFGSLLTIGSQFPLKNWLMCKINAVGLFLLGFLLTLSAILGSIEFLDGISLLLLFITELHSIVTSIFSKNFSYYTYFCFSLCL